jgi:hypothetical protein
MTSSEEGFKIGPMRWNYNLQRYKANRDVFCEPGLISVVFLACGRSEVTRRCFLATLDSVVLYKDELEWIFIENGESDENMQFFESLRMPRKTILRQNNYGINEGLNQGWALSRGEFVMIHENDWECRNQCDFFTTAKEIMNEKPDVGIVQLRAVYDPCENWGLRKPEYSPWSCSADALQSAGIKLWHEKTASGHEYMISNFPNGFNNNPTIIRKSLYRECGPYPEPELGTDPRHGETEYQQRVAKSGCAIAHIGIELFYHCGQVTTKAV